MYDKVFKSILSEPKLKDYLSYLISEITDLDYDYVYDNIRIVNNELLSEIRKGKTYNTDLLINIEENKIDIEANRKYSKGLFVKNSKYQHKISSDLKEGEEYSNNFVYQINFNEFNRFIESNEVVDKVMLVNLKTGEIEEEMYQRYHVNLAKIKKKYYNKEEITLFERRCLILTLQNEKKIKNLIKEDEMMERVYKKMKELNENDDVRFLWDEEKELEKARNYDMKLEKEKAQKEGHEQGMKQGIETRNVEIAKNLLNMNMSIDDIVKATNLTKEEIEKLK